MFNQHLRELMNKLFCVLLVVLCPFFVNAEKALSKDLVQSLKATIEGFQQLTEEYPELEKTFGQNLLSADKAKVLKSIKSLPSYTKIEELVSSAGFKNIDEYYDVTTRIIGAMFAYQANGMSVDAISEIMKAQIDKLKKRDAPKDLIAEMEQDLSNQIESMQAIANLAKSASVADRGFVEKNYLWLMQLSLMTDNDTSEEAY
jgi:hypothetical protein